MLLIYTTSITHRLRYIAEVLFCNVMPVEFTITTALEDYTTYNGAKINYTEHRLRDAEIWIQPHALLFEKNVSSQETNCFEWAGFKAFFATTGDIPFDVFAASFYLISRYEEYLPHEKDEYGRYAHKNSLAYKEGFLHLPVVNMWLKELRKVLEIKFSSLIIHHSPFTIDDSRFTVHDSPPFTIDDSPFTFLPTYDVDIAYSYKGKRLLRNLGGLCKDLFNGNFSGAGERVNVLTGRTDDPFDTFSWLDELHQKYRLHPTYFFMLAEKNRLYDKNVSPNTLPMQKLMKHVAGKYPVGIHPSWQSGDDEKLLTNEINTLAAATGKPVTISRQHYIRLTIPHTYRLLIAKGITEEHSMGYGSINGFRASVASRFYWYDLEAETKTNLLIRPFCYMEANSFFEQHLTAAQAADELQHYHDIVKSVGGELITLFHNHFVTMQPKWIEWRKMYAGFLEKNFG